jgi:hypothetical protein
MQLVRIPDTFLRSVVFLCVEHRGEFKYGGTAFLYGQRNERFPDKHFGYLVTARHNIEKAKQSGNLYVRANLKSGTAEMVAIEDPWFYPDLEASDVAVLPVSPPDEFDTATISSDLILTDDVSLRYGLGVGDEIFSVGLFAKHWGKTRNVPLVRSGIIAAMPGEPLQDPTSGIEYQAYLVEMRSIGGLSGSPVFAYFGVDRILVEDHVQPYFTTSIYLLGLIRGHWPKTGEWLSDFETSEADTINTGIAIVTPIQDVIALIEGDEELTRRRKELERHEAEANTP